MPNSDTQNGVFNKITKEYRLYERVYSGCGAYYEGVMAQSFSGNVETAKSTFLTDDALTCNDTNGTQLEYAITADGNGLKMTIAFGTKGAGTAEADDWAATWRTTKESLVAADKWIKATTYTIESGNGNVVTHTIWYEAIDATPHLF